MLFFELIFKLIFKLIKPFLYNNGAGQMLPIEEFIAIRHKERTGNSSLSIFCRL